MRFYHAGFNLWLVVLTASLALGAAAGQKQRANRRLHQEERLRLCAKKRPSGKHLQMYRHRVRQGQWKKEMGSLLLYGHNNYLWLHIHYYSHR